MQVVVTRPATDGQVWAQALAAAGHEALQLPLIEIASAPHPAEVQACWARLAQFQAVMFVSANAVAGFFANKSGNADAMPRAWATGPGTVRALLAQGVAEALIDAPAPLAAQFDSEALWSVARGQIRGGEQVLIVRGAGSQALENAANRSGRDWLADELGRAGATVEFCTAYQRIRPRFTPAQLAQVQRWVSAEHAETVVWLFSSGEAIDNLALAMPGQSWLLARAMCTHPRIADRARGHGFGVVWESRPTLEDVVASIESVG